jgi:hypothetical protein
MVPSVSTILNTVNRITMAMAAALLLTAEVSPAQEPVQPPPVKKTAPVNDIFSGTVTDLSEESLTVVRTALVRDTVKRTFILDAQTVVEGKLRAKARVTVRFAADESGQFHALHIIVR